MNKVLKTILDSTHFLLTHAAAGAVHPDTANKAESFKGRVVTALEELAIEELEDKLDRERWLELQYENTPVAQLSPLITLKTAQETTPILDSQ